MRIERSMREPIRSGLDTRTRWHGEDDGLIACWERGREMAVERPDTAQQAKDGELMILPWKGGVEKKLKAKAPKIGTYRYLAMWQGLRGDDLDINTSAEVMMTCSKFGQDVLFTHDAEKYADA